MRVSDFDFDLPEDRIALRPVSPRDSAKMLIVRPEAEPELEDRHVRDLPDLLRPGDTLVVNNTKVIPAQLAGRRVGRGEPAPRIDVTLHKRIDAKSWLAFAKPGRKLNAGDRIIFGDEGRVCLLGELSAQVREKWPTGEILLDFDFSGAFLDEAIASLGVMPLPPYIAGRRPADESDRSDYQTLFAREEGAVAAPTAGLHFTPSLSERLEAHGITLQTVTLHVGAGTFLPMKADDTDDHKMHSEWGVVPRESAEALNAARAKGGRIVAVGTTALRLLETASDDAGCIHPWSGETEIFITPGYRFRAIDALMTNFHLPRSTLFMLVSAFSGLERMKRAYAHAIASGYRFYSYGDSSLLFPEPR